MPMGQHTPQKLTLACEGMLRKFGGKEIGGGEKEIGGGEKHANQGISDLDTVRCKHYS